MKYRFYLLGLALTLPAMSVPVSAGNESYVYQGEELGENFDVRRPILQQTDPNVDDVVHPDGIRQCYLKNRRALTGEGCHVNTLINVVDVANAAVNVTNLTDDDISNVAEFAQGVGVEIGVGPIVSVRDVNNYYAGGTNAGFCIVASNGTSVLSLDVIKMMAIGFYRDGKLIGTVAASQGSAASGVDLSLVQIAGSDAASMIITAEAPGVFDEISLNSAGGLNLSAIGGLRVKYAFVGDARRYIMNRDYSVNEGTILKPDYKTYKGGITLFNEDNGRNIALNYAQCNALKPNGSNGVDKFIDNPDDSYTIGAVLSIGGCSAQFHMQDNDAPEDEVFEAGTEVGFKIGMGSLLKLGVGSGTTLTLYDRKGNETESIIVNAGVLDLGIAKVDAQQMFSTTATKPFSGAKLFIGKGLEVDLGATTAYYAYIQKAPDQTHTCPLNMSSNIYLAPTATSHRLAWNPALNEPIEFSLISKPEGSTATISSDGVVDGIDKKGEYVVMARVAGDGHDNCVQHVVIKNDQFEHVGGTVAGSCATPLTNGITGTTYVPSKTVYETSGALLSISDLSSADNITDADHDNYAEYTGGLGIANDVRITGVKRADGEAISDGTVPVRIGFVVEESVNGLNAKVLQFMQIRCYYKAEKGDKAVYSHIIDESNVIAADVIGTGKVTKVRYTIEVPQGYMFDEFQLWKSGVLDLSLSNLKVYYPFIEEADSPCCSLLGCDGRLVSQHASISPVQGGGVSVGQYVSNLSNLIDNDIDSYMTVGNTIQVGQVVLLSVGMGQTIDPSHQVGIIVDNKTYLAGINAGSWLKVKLRRTTGASEDGNVTSEDTGDEFVNWSVADANVAGYGDKNVLFFTPTKPFDEIYMEIGGIAGVTDGQHYYGIMTRGDSDKDGIPDCMDTNYSVIEPPVTGVGSVSADSNTVVRVTGNIVTVECGTGISAVVAYDMAGHVTDIINANGRNEASLELSRGMHALLIELSDGTATAIKLAL